MNQAPPKDLSIPRAERADIRCSIVEILTP